MAYLLLAALSTPLVLSVHSVVSFDFATSVVPGWHTTIFPPYFVAGAIFGGFAMVQDSSFEAREIRQAVVRAERRPCHRQGQELVLQQETAADDKI
jgi:Ni/Fe-hydrogenase subunit HybB-like protein